MRLDKFKLRAGSPYQTIIISKPGLLCKTGHSLFPGFYFLYSRYLWSEGFSVELVMYIYLFLFFGSIPIFAELDAWSRWQNYKLFRDIIYKYGYRDRFAKSLIHSRCQREAAYIAALDVGLVDPVARFYYKKGYRWYHIIPDFVFNSPGYLLTRNFWNTTFFAKKYKVKYFPE